MTMSGDEKHPPNEVDDTAGLDPFADEQTTEDDLSEAQEAADFPEPSSDAEPQPLDPEDSASDEEDSADPQAELEAAKAEAQSNWDRAVRLQADLDNQRRRFEKQVDDAHKYSSQKFVEAILPVMDSLEMGRAAEGDVNAIKEGMDLTIKQFQTVFEKFNVEVIGEVGDTFDPEKHQAVSMQPSPEHENNTLMAVMQKGYALNGRTVRPAMVVVCKHG